MKNKKWRRKTGKSKITKRYYKNKKSKKNPPQKNKYKKCQKLVDYVPCVFAAL